MRKWINVTATNWIIITMTKKIWMNVFVTVKCCCCPTPRVALFFSSNVAPVLHFRNMVLELFLHHIQHNITVSVTPWSSLFIQIDTPKKRYFEITLKQVIQSWNYILWKAYVCWLTWESNFSTQPCPLEFL